MKWVAFALIVINNAENTSEMTVIRFLILNRLLVYKASSNIKNFLTKK